MDEALIRYKDVEIHQQELCVLNDVNLELHKGEFVYLIGKVGSGKTSLLKTFYGELDVAAQLAVRVTLAAENEPIELVKLAQHIEAEFGAAKEFSATVDFLFGRAF